MFSHVIKNAFLLYFISMLFSCTQPSNGMPAQEEATAAALLKERTEIQYQPIKRGSFILKNQATGVLAATAVTEIKASQSGQLKSMPIKEGVLVKKNALLAQLDPTAIELQLEKARLTLEEAEFNKNDLLVMQGGTWGVDSSVNETTLFNIHQQSGYKKAIHAIKELEYQLSQTKITAPFSGVVAELKVNPHQYLGANETICTLIDPYGYEAEFSLLEKEAAQVKIGQSVKVSPLARPEQVLRGQVSSVNPMVDEHGLVRVHASINQGDLRQGSQGRLFEGMNVRVTLEQSIANQLIVPKTAVVLRSGKSVVFTYHEASGLAKWNYVTIGHENDQEVAISEGLEDGSLIIFEGNLNLDHDAEVTVKTQSSATNQ